MKSIVVSFINILQKTFESGLGVLNHPWGHNDGSRPKDTGTGFQFLEIEGISRTLVLSGQRFEDILFDFTKFKNVTLDF